MPSSVTENAAQPVGASQADKNSLLPIAVVLTQNEELNLEACLCSLAELIHTVYVVDSGSTDRTAEIAERYGAVFLQHPFESHTQQWRWALDQLPLTAEWILGLDADQRLTSELREELRRLFHGPADQLEGVHGFYVKRRQVFRGRWIRHGGYYPKYLLKLFRRDKLVLDVDELVDHHFYVDGPVRKLRFDLIEDNRKEDDISFWIDKHNRYATRLAHEEVRRAGRTASPIAPRLFGSPDQRILWLKSRWHRLPRYLRPVAYFVYRYFIRLGFLDGKEGFTFHFLQALWFRLLIDIEVEEILRRQAVK
jgi:glycosyltransferase involved in cell wall biosynthesis